MRIRNLLTAALLLFLFQSLFSQKVESRPWQIKCDSSLFDSLSGEHIQFMGGLELFIESDPHFGGLSALWVQPDGMRMLAFSDFTSIRGPFSDSLRGQWYEFVPLFDSKHQLRDIIHTKTGRLLLSDGRPLSEIESVASDGKTLYIAKDNGKALAGSVLLISLSKFDKPGEYRVDPDTILVPEFPKEAREGFEAMDLLPNGSLLMIREGGSKEFRDTWILNRHTEQYLRAQYRLNEGAVKGMTHTADGDMLLVEKIYQKGHTKMAVSLLNKNAVESDTLEAKVLLRAESDCLDNFEGISTFQSGGEEYFFLVSDNNGDWQKPGRQKSLLLLFRLKH